jgi:hypothetical protein
LVHPLAEQNFGAKRFSGQVPAASIDSVLIFFSRVESFLALDT